MPSWTGSQSACCSRRETRKVQSCAAISWGLCTAFRSPSRLRSMSPGIAAKRALVCAPGILPPQDAPLVTRLRAAGAIILGVTNTPELLMAWETDNLLYGRTNNPWDLTRTPGGSSGGEVGGHCGGTLRGRRRQRRRWFDSRACALQRNLRTEADARTNSFDRTLSEIGRTVCVAWEWWDRWHARWPI